MNDDMIQWLSFNPQWGCKNPHIQTILAGLVKPDIEPPSKTVFVDIGLSDQLCCQISTPPTWQPKQKTVVLVHGLGGSETSAYMIRLTRKLFDMGIKAVRVNLRNCGSGKGLSHLPYHSGNSPDLLAVLNYLKNESPHSPITVAGFSLGGNILLKLLGEMAESSRDLIDFAIAVCPPLDLKHTVQNLNQGVNRLYERYYLRHLNQQLQRWICGRKIRTLYEYDQLITAVEWGFRDPEEYYETCSSLFFLPKINCPCYLLLAADDPIIDYQVVKNNVSNPSIKVWLSPYGGHMGFFSQDLGTHGRYWLDHTILDWISSFR